MVSTTRDTAKLRLSGGAGARVASPSSARTVQVPSARSVIVEPSVPPAAHTAGVVLVKETGRPDEAVALTVTGDCSIVFAEIVGKVMVWRTRTSSVAVAVSEPTVTMTTLVPVVVARHRVQRARAVGADAEHHAGRLVAECVPVGVEAHDAERLRRVRADDRRRG